MTSPSLPAAPAAAARGPLRRLQVAVLCSLLFGISVTEAVSNNLLPLTLRQFTENAFYIGLILAINPLFGFIAQPLVGVLSDHIWTPVGRRAFFLITGAPVVAACLIFIPVCRLLWPVVVLVVVYQFFEDVLYGSDHPLLADLIPPAKRSLVAGMMMVSAQLATLFVMFVGMPLVRRHELAHDGALFGAPLYWIAAAAQVLFVSAAAFFLGERPVERQRRPPLTVGRYVRDFAEQPMLLRLGLINFLRAFQANAVGGFIALYATQTLLVDTGVFGRTWGMLPLVSLPMAIPIGWLVERFAKQRMIVLGFVGAIAGCALGYYASPVGEWAARGLAAALGAIGVDSAAAQRISQALPAAGWGLMVAAVVTGVTGPLVDVTYKAFITDYFPADIIGQLAGAINIFYATGRTLALVLVGRIVLWQGNDYRVIWLVSGAVAIVSMAVLLSIRDLRYEDRVRMSAAGRSR